MPARAASASCCDDEQLAKSLSSASANLDQVTGRLSRGDGTAGKLLTDKQLYDRFNSVAAADRQADDAISSRDREPPGSCSTTSSYMRT